MRRHRGAPGHGPSLLILRGGGVGRFLAGVPAYRALRRAFPRHHVVIATSGWLRPLAGLTEALDGVIHARPRPGGLVWAGPSPDVAVNLHDQGPDSHVLLHALWPARTIAFASPAAPAGMEGPAWSDGEPETTRWCRLLESFGIPADPGDLTLAPPRTPSPAPGATVVHTGTPAGRTPWPASSYAEVVRVLRQAGHPVVVTGWGLNSGASTVEEWDELSHEGRVADLDALASLVSGCALLICGDPEVAALAGAYEKPSIVVGASEPDEEDKIDDVLARAEQVLSGARGPGGDTIWLPTPAGQASRASRAIPRVTSSRVSPNVSQSSPMRRSMRRSV